MIIFRSKLIYFVNIVALNLYVFHITGRVEWFYFAIAADLQMN